MRVIAGEWRGRRIDAPAGRQTRPTSDRVREAWMSTVASFLEGADVLDLFAGSGALGIEALSRGAAHVTFVDNAADALRVLRTNLATLGAESHRFRVVRADALRFTSAIDAGTFRLAFADPPYGSPAAAQLARTFRERPFATLLGIEHSRAQQLESGPDLFERRYGDTVLSFLMAPDEHD